MALQDTYSVSAAWVNDPGQESLTHWRRQFPRLHLDLGCGDARFALLEVRGHPDVGVVGIDTCLDNVRIPRRSLPANLRLIQADGRAITDLSGGGGAQRITINFPYGSLLRWGVDESAGFFEQLASIVAPGGSIELRVNASALQEVGAAREELGRHLAGAVAEQTDWRLTNRTMGQLDLRRFPSTWARRIGYGRETSALEVIACRRS